MPTVWAESFGSRVSELLFCDGANSEMRKGYVITLDVEAWG